jgi:hypothetical protein
MLTPLRGTDAAAELQVRSLLALLVQKNTY